MEPGRTPLLAGRTALVTGGSRGLGRALCTVFAREGARVAFTWTRDEEACRHTLDAIATAGAPGLAYRISVLDPVATSVMVQQLEQAAGGLDVLVNNAGISQSLPLALLEEEDWDRVLDVNVKGAYLTARAVLRGMIRRRRGAVLNIGSLAGMRIIDSPVHYAAAKAALRGMTAALAREVARHGIRVNCLAPGLLEEGMGQNIPDYRLADYLQHCALGRLGGTEEVARFAAFLVSDQNSFMTGETLIMDGGV